MRMTEQEVDEHHDVDEQRVLELDGWRQRDLTRLYCMNGGHHLQISRDGTVLGRRGDTEDMHSVLKLTAVASGVVVILGTEARCYLAMNDGGRLYSSSTVTDECYFLEKLEENNYNTYMSQKHQDKRWYVALKKNGKPKLGARTHVGEKAIFFLPRVLGDTPEQTGRAERRRPQVFCDLKSKDVKQH